MKGALSKMHKAIVKERRIVGFKEKSKHGPLPLHYHPNNSIEYLGSSLGNPFKSCLGVSFLEGSKGTDPLGDLSIL